MYEIFLNGSLIYSTSRVELQRGIITKSFHLEVQKAGALEFTVHPSHPAYDEFRSLVSEVTVTDDGEEIFRGRVLSQSTTFYGERTVSCEGNLAYLNDSVLPSTDDVTESVESFFRRCISTHNSQVENWKQFEVGEITVEAKDQSVTFKKTGYQTVLSAIENELLKYYGGFLRTRHEGQTTYIDYIEDYDIYLSQPIQFSVNLLDLTEDTNPEEIYTIMVPVGKDNLTIESQNGGSNELVNETLVGIFGRIYKPESFSDIDDPYLLMTTAQAKMYRDMLSFVPKYSCKALDLHLMYPDLDKLLIGCNVHLTSDPQEIDVEAMILSADIDMQNPENNTYEIGIYSQDREERKTLSSQESGNAQSAADSNSKVAATSSKAASDAAKSITQVKYELDRTGEKITDNAKKISLIATDEELAKIQSGDIESIYSQSRLELEATQSALYTNAQKLTDTGVALMNAGVFNSITERKDENGKVIGYDVDSNLTASKIEVDTVGDKVDLTQSKLLEAGVFNHIDQDGTIHTELVARKALVDATADDIAATKRSLVEAGVYSDIDAQGNPSINTVASKLELGEVKNTADGAKEAADDAKDEVDLTKAKLLEAGVFSKINQDGSVETQLVARKSQVDATAEDIAATKQTLAEAGVYASLDAQGNPTIVNKVVSEDGVISAINNTTEGVIINSSKVDLGKYATVADLEANYIKTTNLESSIASISSLEINGLVVNGGAYFHDIYVMNVDGHQYDISVNGVKLGEHTHSMTVANDGTVTLGPAKNSTGSPETFNIAATSFYKSGVAAAKVEGKTELTEMILNGEATAVLTPSSNGKVSTTPVTLTDSEGVTLIANVPANFDVSAIYNKGHSDGESVGYTDGKVDGKAELTSMITNGEVTAVLQPSSNGKVSTTPVTITDSEGTTLIANVPANFDVSAIYNKGYNAGVASGSGDVTITAAGWDNGSNVVTASNGKTLTIKLPTFSSSQSDWSNHQKTVYFSTPSVDGPLKTEVVDATSEYNAGLADAVGSMVSGPTIYNIYQDAANKKVTFDIGYRLNGQSTMTYVSKEISVSDIYTSGYNTGFAAVGFASGPTITNQAEDDEYNRVGFDLVYQLDNQSSAVTRHYTIATPTIYNRAYQAGYNAGYTAGGNDAVGSMVSGPTLYNVNQDTANQKVTFDVGYKLNGQSKMTYVLKEVSANSIYTSGYNSGYTIGLNKGKQDGANGITISSVDYETFYIEEEDVDVLKFTIKLSNGATKYYEINMDEMMIPEHGSGGGGSGTVDVLLAWDTHSISVERSGNRGNYTYTVKSQAIASYTTSDGRSGKITDWQYYDASSIYDSGYSDGYSDGSTAGQSGTSVQGVLIDNVEYHNEYYNKQINFDVVVTLTNGSSESYARTVSGKEAYDSGYSAGQTAGRNSVSIDTNSFSVSGTPRYYRNQQTYYFDVYAETSTGASGTASGLELYAHDAWQHGYDDGKSQVWVSDISYSVEENSDEHNKYLKVVITLNNGRTHTWEYNLD